MSNIKFTTKQRHEAVGLYSIGMTFAQVSAATGISEPYLKDLVRKSRIPVRPSGFQLGNTSRSGRPHSKETKAKTSRTKKKYSDPVSQMIWIYHHNATKRGLSYSITREEFEKLIFGDCFYCGGPPKNRKINTNILRCNGIDRVDNSLGYDPSNLRTACILCNRMKWDLGFDLFLRKCREIANRHRE